MWPIGNGQLCIDAMRIIGKAVDTPNVHHLTVICSEQSDDVFRLRSCDSVVANVAVVMLATVHIAAQHEIFCNFREMAPVCTPFNI